MSFVPNMVRPLYCAVFASPKKINHNTPFAELLIGSTICAKEMM